MNKGQLNIVSPQFKANPFPILADLTEILGSDARYATGEVTVHGVTIPRGQMTLGVIGSANRDVLEHRWLA